MSENDACSGHDVGPVVKAVICLDCLPVRNGAVVSMIAHLQSKEEGSMFRPAEESYLLCPDSSFPGGHTVPYRPGATGFVVRLDPGWSCEALGQVISF